MFDKLTGPCDVRFVGEIAWVKIDVKCVWFNGSTVSIEDTSGAFYNWNNVIVIRKVRV